MSKNEMGYRGSKSITCFKSVIVKEQRVDGSWFISPVQNQKKINEFKVYSSGFREKLSDQNPF